MNIFSYVQIFFGHKIAIMLLIFVYPILLCLALVVIVLLVTYRFVVSTILKFKYGNEFAGLMESFDHAFELEEISSNVVNSITINSTHCDIEEFTKIIKRHAFEKILQRPRLFPKLSYMRKCFFGYHFMLKGNNYENTVRIFNVKTNKDVIDNNDLMEVMQELSKQNFANKSKLFGEIVILDKPISIIRNDETLHDMKKNFVVVLRIHHSLGDGFAIIRYIHEHFCSIPNLELNNFKKILKKKDHQNLKSRRLVDKINLFTELVCKLAIDIPKYSVHYFLKDANRNILNRKRLVGQEVVAWHLEMEEKHVKLVKEIKKHFPKTSFSDVVLAALSAALSDHFKEDCKNYSNSFLTTYIPVPFMREAKEVNLTNSFVNFTLHIPLFEGSFEERLNQIKKQTQRISESTDLLISYWCQKFITLFPKFIIQRYSHIFLKHSSVTSIIPLSEDIPPFFPEATLEEVLLLCSEAKNVGFAMIIASLKNKFQFSINVDKGLIPDKKSAIKVLQDILTNIEKFHNSIYHQTQND